MEFKWYKYGDEGTEDAFEIRREVFCREVGFTEDFEFDGDVFCQHNAFRAPGAPTKEIFELQPNKTDYFKGIYGNMHRHISSHPYHLDEENLSELDALDFVFIAMDSGRCKQLIVN